MLTSMRVNRVLLAFGVAIGVICSAAAQKISNSQVIRDCKLDKYVLIWESSPVGDRIICIRKLQIANAMFPMPLKD